MIVFVSLLALTNAAFSDNATFEEFKASLQLPSGFEIELFASGMPHCRSMVSTYDAVFVGSFDFDGISGNAFPSNVYAIPLRDGVKAERVVVVAGNLSAPNGVAFDGKDLFVAENFRLLKIPNVLANVDKPAEPVLVSTAFFNASAAYPLALWHGWRYIKVHGDRLYMAVGSPCNTPADPPDANATCKCLLEGEPCGYPKELLPYIGSIISAPIANWSDFRVEAHGIRNSVGFDWLDNELWFTDNGRDNWDPDHDNRPPDELNRVVNGSNSTHFGFPFCYSDLIDYEFNKLNSCAPYVMPQQQLQPHAAAIGMRFYDNVVNKSFPEGFHHGVFIAEHGSWDRTPPVGYRISFVGLNLYNAPVLYDSFLSGFLQWTGGDNSNASMKPPTYGRPADVEFLADGSMLVTNDKRGEIYRIYYKQTNYLLIILISLGVVVVIAVAAAIAWKRRKASSYVRV